MFSLAKGLNGRTGKTGQAAFSLMARTVRGGVRLGRAGQVFDRLLFGHHRRAPVAQAGRFRRQKSWHRWAVGALGLAVSVMFPGLGIGDFQVRTVVTGQRRERLGSTIKSHAPALGGAFWYARHRHARVTKPGQFQGSAKGNLGVGWACAQPGNSGTLPGGREKARPS